MDILNVADNPLYSHKLLVSQLMKFFTLIMAFLVLALSCLPCADKDCVGKDDVKTALTKSADETHKSHDDSCSPFCHCSCCSSYLVAQSIPFFTFNRTYSSAYFETLVDDDLIEISLPVWQPPQLV